MLTCHIVVVLEIMDMRKSTGHGFFPVHLASRWGQVILFLHMK